EPCEPPPSRLRDLQYCQPSSPEPPLRQPHRRAPPQSTARRRSLPEQRRHPRPLSQQPTEAASLNLSVKIPCRLSLPSQTHNDLKTALTAGLDKCNLVDLPQRRHSGTNPLERRIAQKRHALFFCLLADLAARLLRQQHLA